MNSPEANQVRRVELILQQVDALPTLSPVAVRLLDLTTAENSDATEVIQLVSSDPALTVMMSIVVRSPEVCVPVSKFGPLGSP